MYMYVVLDSALCVATSNRLTCTLEYWGMRVCVNNRQHLKPKLSSLPPPMQMYFLLEHLTGVLQSCVHKLYYGMPGCVGGKLLFRIKYISVTSTVSYGDHCESSQEARLEDDYNGSL